MSVKEPNQAKQRTSALTWYSVYQSQVVGQPKALWGAPEDPVKMSNGYGDDDDDSALRNSAEGESTTFHWNHSKDSDDVFKDGDQPHSNKFIGHSVTLDNGSSSSQALLRPLSMDFRWTQPTDEAEPRMLNRSWSTIPTWDDYEEFKLPKRYQKPTNKINTRLSRTYITGAGSDKCKKCGQRLYEMEKINANHSSYHRKCFQCYRCQRQLSLSTFISMDGQLYCNSHFIDVVCNKPSMSEVPLSNALDEKLPHLPDTQDISNEVTLRNIADIKSRFESPSSNQIESERRKVRNQEPQKILLLTEDVSSAKAITSSMTRDDVQGQQHSKPTIKDSGSSHDNMSFELRPEKTRHLNENGEVFATHQSITSPPFIDDGDDDILQVADAFAKFKNMENMHMERILSAEIKPVRKTPPVQDMKTSAKHSLPENKDIRNHLSSDSDTQTLWPGEKLSAVSIQELAMKNKMNQVSKDLVKSEEKKRAEVDSPGGLEKEVPPFGITKQLVAQWKLMDSVDGSSVHRGSTASVISTPSVGEMALHGTSKISNTTAHSLVNGFPPTKTGSNCGNTLELVRRHNETAPQDTKVFRKSGSLEVAAIAPLDFTRNQLVKFKELEVMAQKSANLYPPPKKDFRWGVKEVSPLHRPTVQANLTPAHQSELKLDRSKPSAIHSPPPLIDQRDAVWNGWKTYDHHHHPANPVATHDSPLADQRHAGTEEQPTTLACMKEALAQFKSMEDFTRPAPNPVLALSKQKAAIATHMKQYHDIIHISYAMQTV